MQDITNSSVKFFILTMISSVIVKSDKPNIVLVVADDMGWNDCGFHGSTQIPTPNLDALAYNGIQLNALYAASWSTPTRVALLTGKYAIRTGMQHKNIGPSQRLGLGSEHRIMPEYFKDLGYKTHAVGKWHLGYSKAAYTPTRRGFDSHFGFWNGFQDYYEHTVVDPNNKTMKGVDMRRNMSLAIEETRGLYTTTLFTTEAKKIIEGHPKNESLFLYLAYSAPHAPLQAPPKIDERVSKIMDEKRRIYAGMIHEMDTGIGEIISTLHKSNMLNNTIIVFLSDNGAPSRTDKFTNSGSNYPLRGFKGSPWEGGVRVAGILWSAKLISGYTYEDPMHVVDLLPTLYSAAGGNPESLMNIDGNDAWASLLDNEPMDKDFLIHADVPPGGEPTYWAARSGKWKILWIWDSDYIQYWTDNPDTSSLDSLAIYNASEVLHSQTGSILGEYGVTLTLKRLYERHEAGKVKCGNFIPKYPPKCVRNPCLFDIEEDPCEMVDVSRTNKHLYKSLKDKVARYLGRSEPAKSSPSDPLADPALHGGAWSCWEDELGGKVQKKEVIAEQHWEIVGAVAAIVGLFMVVITVYALLKKTQFFYVQFWNHRGTVNE